MLRRLALTGLVLAASAAGLPARAQPYCSGAILPAGFDTRVTPGPGGRATYTAFLINTGPQARNYQIVVTAPFLERPAPTLRSIPPGSRPTPVSLGYQVIQPGQTPLRASQLAEVVRVSCP